MVKLHTSLREFLFSFCVAYLFSKKSFSKKGRFEGENVVFFLSKTLFSSSSCGFCARKMLSILVPIHLEINLIGEDEFFGRIPLDSILECLFSDSESCELSIRSISLVVVDSYLSIHAFH